MLIELLFIIIKKEVNYMSIEWMKQRHSVRVYDGKPLSFNIEKELNKKISAINQESHQHFQLVVNEPNAFSSSLAKYGKFENAVNYIALIGNNEEKIGYYGEELVKCCTLLGLKTCWVGLTYKKEKQAFSIGPKEKLFGLIALGTSDKNGSAHPLRSINTLSIDTNPKPDWFLEGMKGVQLAPSALNQQKYRFGYKNGKVQTKKGIGFYTAMDLGIAKYHFDQASQKNEFRTAYQHG